MEAVMEAGFKFIEYVWFWKMGADARRMSACPAHKFIKRDSIKLLTRTKICITQVFFATSRYYIATIYFHFLARHSMVVAHWCICLYYQFFRGGSCHNDYYLYFISIFYYLPTLIRPYPLLFISTAQHWSSMLLLRVPRGSVTPRTGAPSLPHFWGAIYLLSPLHFFSTPHYF